MESFSQNAEDKVFIPLLPPTGKLMEIGAFHPEQLSNSRALIKAGWEAVLVEANPLSLQNIVNFYRTEEPNERVKIVSSLVALNDTPEIVPFHLCWNAVSTTEAHHLAIWKDSVEYLESHMTTTPVKLLFQAFPGPYDFVSIDVEGTSGELAEFVMAHVKPSVCCVEHQTKDHAHLRTFAEENGYAVVTENAENYIFARNYPLPVSS